MPSLRIIEITSFRRLVRPSRLRVQEPVRTRLPSPPSFLRRNRTLVYFVLGFLALDILVGQFSSLWQRHSPDDYTLRIEACKEHARDFVLLGGSPVAEGLNPAAIAGFAHNGITLQDGYTLGMSGGTTSDFYYALLHACPTPPKVLVYGITASDLNDSRGEPHGPHSLLTRGDLAEWVQVRPETCEWAVRHFLYGRVDRVSSLYRFRHAIRMWAAMEADLLMPGCCPETFKEATEQHEYAAAIMAGNGYAPMKGFQVAPFTEFKRIGTTGTRFDRLHYLDRFRTGSHLKYLHKIIDWCETNGVEFVLLDMPVTADLERLYVKEFAEFRERLADVEQTRIVKVLRPTRDELQVDDDYFADLIHLNRRGAEKLSAWTKSQLDAAKHRDLP